MTHTDGDGNRVRDNAILWISGLALALALAMMTTGCASSGTAGPPPVQPVEGAVGAKVDLLGDPVGWVRENPGKTLLTLGGAYAAWAVADHNGWIGGRGDGDRRATSTGITVTGDNNRIVIATDQATASGSGESNTGSGGQGNVGGQ